MLSKCQSCGEDYPNWKIKYQDLDLWECQICNSLSYLKASSVDNSNLYGKDYFAGNEYVDYQGDRKIHEKNFSLKWNELRKHFSGPVRVFEIGCAYGYFINHVIKNGSVEAFGIDISGDAINEARKNFGEYFGMADERPIFQYNCLVAWDVWEHLTDPFDKFQAEVDKLEPGGIFAFTTVDSSSFVAKLRGRKWRQIHPPTHLHYPSRKAVSLAAKKLGLEVLEHKTFSPKRSWKTYLSALGISGGSQNSGFSVDLRDIQFSISRKPFKA